MQQHAKQQHAARGSYHGARCVGARGACSCDEESTVEEDDVRARAAEEQGAHVYRIAKACMTGLKVLVCKMCGRSVVR